MFKKIFEPIILANQEIRNRIFMAPMGTGFEEQYYGGKVSTEMIDFYEARAKGGVGLIISPFAAVDERYFALTLGIYSRKLLQGISRLAEALHVYDCKFLAQLSHFGGKSPKFFTHGKVPIAPSSIDSKMYPERPREMTLEEIEEIIDLYIKSAQLARDAGCDGVELHGAHGYLINQFYSPHSNKRNDKYGGTLEKRLNFLVKIADGIRKECGNDFIIGFKFSAHEHLEGGIKDELAIEICRYLDMLDILDYIHVSGNTVTIPGFTDCSYPEVPPIYNGYPLVPLAEKIKISVKTPVAATGGITDPSFVEDMLTECKADLVVLGRALIADPEWPNKAKSGGNLKYCIKCNACYKRILNQQSIKCSVNPYVGEERRYSIFTNFKSSDAKKLFIAGGGPAGMESAIVAASRGYKVTLLENKDSVGGNLRLAASYDYKFEFKKLLNYYELELKNKNINLQLNTAATPEYILAENPDTFFIAIGSKPLIPDIPGLENELKINSIFNAHEVIGNSSIELGKEIIIIGAGLVGCELALSLALKGKKIYLLDCLEWEKILIDEPPVNRSMLLTALQKQKIDLLSGFQVTEIINKNTLVALDSKKNEKKLDADNIIISAGYLPRNLEAKLLKEKLMTLNPKIEIKLIGDCFKIGKIFDAVNKGAQAAWQL
jgi:2,4-dienoyl-CoA reductase-like NADH-dependent reductase (Old Yellow Enzyme family)/thioredoxin reductase